MIFRVSASSRWLLSAGVLGGSVVLAVACDSGNHSEPAAGGAGPSNTAGASSTAGAANRAGAGNTAGAGNSAGSGNATGTSGASNGTAGTGNSAGANSTGGAAGAAGAPPVAGAGGAAGAGTCAGALVCDDFESYSDKPAGPWTVSTNNGMVALDTTKHFSGSKSVKFSTTGANAYQRAYIGLTGAPFPIANNAFYGRMMMYVTKAANDGVHWTMIQAEGPVAAQGITNAQVRYGGQQMQSLMANYDSTGKTSDCWQHSATKMPEGKWACMQWYFDGKTNTQKFWLDGVAISDLTVTGTGQGCVHEGAGTTMDNWYYPQDFTKAYVGWESYQTDDAREAWIDDFALDIAPIACPAAMP